MWQGAESEWGTLVYQVKFWRARLVAFVLKEDNKKMWNFIRGLRVWSQPGGWRQNPDSVLLPWRNLHCCDECENQHQAKENQHKTQVCVCVTLWLNSPSRTSCWNHSHLPVQLCRWQILNEFTTQNVRATLVHHIFFMTVHHFMAWCNLNKRQQAAVRL